MGCCDTCCRYLGRLYPVSPRALASLVRSFWQFGPTPAMLLAASAIRFPDRAALIDDSGQLTYRDLQRRAEAVAAAVYARTPSAPRSVGIICRNHRGFAESMLAGAQLGAELVFINTELTPQQLGRSCNVMNPTCWCTTTNTRRLSRNLSTRDCEYWRGVKTRKKIA